MTKHELAQQVASNAGLTGEQAKSAVVDPIPVHR